MVLFGRWWTGLDGGLYRAVLVLRMVNNTVT